MIRFLKRLLRGPHPLIISGLIALSFSFINCSEKSKESADEIKAPIAVFTEVVIPGTVRRPVYCSGIVHPVRQEKLFFRAGGKIESIFKPAGSRVRKDEKLASLVSLPLLKEWERQGLKLIEERNKLYQMQGELEQGTISRRIYQEQQRKTSIRRDVYFGTKSAMNHADLYSPFSGRIVNWFVDPGDSVTLAQSVCLLVETEPNALVKMGVPEVDYHHIQVGDSVTVKLAEKPELPLKGTICKRGITDQVAELAYQLEAIFENPGGIAQIGTPVSVTIRQRTTETAIQIPVDALVDRNGNTASVFLTDSKGKFAVRRHVILGPEIGKKVLVEKGLHKGDRLIIHGQQRLVHGSPILTLP